MARRATSSSKGRAATKNPAPVEIPEPMADKPLRRTKMVKSNDMPPANNSIADAFFPGGDEPTSGIADTTRPALAKARRVRKPAEQASSEPPASADKGTEAAIAPSSVAAADAASSAAAARWDAETGTATFDWPAIEAVAAIGGANQSMAKLLLAARAEGANSRWPF